LLGTGRDPGLQDHLGDVGHDATCLFVALHQFKLYIAYSQPMTAILYSVHQVFSILEKESSSAKARMSAISPYYLLMADWPRIFLRSSGVSCCRTSWLNLSSSGCE
jgi:hypothetical protein